MTSRDAAAKAAIVLLPSYAAAWFTDKMVYVVPTLAAPGFFASALDLSGPMTRVEEDGPDGADHVDHPDHVDHADTC